ncbi:PIN domain-containing protein [Sphaerotilus sp.]|uniref:PIN domain-containing protein n=1 Tax=Sphaerotilus sp. TaxID=2093942 RepID=UPI002ACD3498|nr:PIN domain-containing protein [Sphaerotilus sp.]MDZ7858365.1 PIN domain-containing protein [Sphaerotilus sp.]
MILLDTNLCVYVIKTRPPEVLARFNDFEPQDLAVSVVTAMELRVGALRASGTHYAGRVDALLGQLSVQPLGAEVVDFYSRTKVDLQRRGERIGPMDLLIAVHALSLGATLVTNTEREFRRIAGLRVENWVRAEG